MPTRQVLTILLVSAVVLVPAMARVYQRATVQTTKTHEGSRFSHSSDSAPNKTTSVCGLSAVWQLAAGSRDTRVGHWEMIPSNIDKLPFLNVAEVPSFRAPPVPQSL